MMRSSRLAAMIPFLNSRNRSVTFNIIIIIIILIIIIHIIIFITFHGRFSSSFLLTSSTVTRSSEQQESIVSPRDKIGLNMKLTSANFVIASAL